MKRAYFQLEWGGKNRFEKYLERIENRLALLAFPRDAAVSHDGVAGEEFIERDTVAVREKMWIYFF